MWTMLRTNPGLFLQEFVRRPRDLFLDAPMIERLIGEAGYEAHRRNNWYQLLS